LKVESDWNGTSGLVVAFDGLKEVGMLTFAKGSFGLVVNFVHVRDEYRRQGIATTMAKRAVEVMGTTEATVPMITGDGQALADTLGLDLEILD
jgi:predicted GNAT family acetyltransferase